MTNIIMHIQSKIQSIEEDFIKYPPQYCGIEEAETQRREKDAKIEILYELIAEIQKLK